MEGSGRSTWDRGEVTSNRGGVHLLVYDSFLHFEFVLQILSCNRQNRDCILITLYSLFSY